MTNYTPGPWHTKITADGELWLVISSDFEIYLGDLEETDKERHANARLMAAAPDMLAALKTIIDTIAWEVSEAVQECLWKEIKMAKSAIAKATGGNDD